MTPAERAKAICEQAGESFVETIEAHLLHGFIYSTPDHFLAARPIPRSADVSDLWRIWPRSECDAWFVWLCVGSAAKAVSLMPYYLPWLGWHRIGRAWQDNHWQSTDRVRRLMKVRVSTCATVL